MDISLAVVTSRKDPDNLGVMQCIISKLGPDPLPVYYTSPFATNADGGMIAVPEVGVVVPHPINHQSVHRGAGLTSFVDGRQQLHQTATSND